MVATEAAAFAGTVNPRATKGIEADVSRGSVKERDQWPPGK